MMNSLLTAWRGCKAIRHNSPGPDGARSLLRPLRGKSGFTLLEILVSVVILSVGILGVTSMQIASINGQLLSRNLDTAFNVVHDALDRMQANSENITDYIHSSYSSPFVITVNPNNTNPSMNAERPAGVVAGDDYDALYFSMLDMNLSSGVLTVTLTNDFPVTGVDTAEAVLTWNYKGAEKTCTVTTIITKASRKS